MKKLAVLICIVMVFLCLVSCETEPKAPTSGKIEKTDISADSAKTGNIDGKSFYQWFKNKELAEAVANDFNKKPTDLISKKELREYSGEIEACFGINDTVKNLEGISLLKNIESLSSYKNDVKVVPDEITKLKNLKVLDLCKAFSLEKLPENIGDLKNLERVRLDFTLIKKLPKSFAKLKKLKYLSLSASEITELPEDIDKLENLEVLVIDSTNIKKLPESLSNLKKLKKLICRDSFVENLPKNIGDMSALQVVDMFNCRLTAVPESVKNLKELKYFNVFDNFGITDESYKNRISKKALSCEYNYFDDN